MRITLTSTLLALTLLAGGVAQAAEAQHPAHQDMQKSMETMHQGMEEGLKAKDPEMRKLAEDIIQAQQKEIDQLNRWIKAHAK